jgi:hypothetical protein
MKNQIIAALIIALAILGHAYIIKPPTDGVIVPASKSAFEKATIEALKYTIGNIGKEKDLKSIKIEDVRFSHDGTMVAVQYAIGLENRNITSGLIFKGDEFGRYSAEGIFEGEKVWASVK